MHPITSIKKTTNKFFQMKAFLKLLFMDFFLSISWNCSVLIPALSRVCVHVLSHVRPADSNPPGSSVHGILPAWILEWFSITSSGGSSWPRDWTEFFMSPALAGGFLTTSTTWGTPHLYEFIKSCFWFPFWFHMRDLTYLHSTSCEMPGWIKHKLESSFPGEIQRTSDTQMTPHLWQKVKRWRASW